MVENLEIFGFRSRLFMGKHTGAVGWLNDESIEVQSGLDQQIAGMLSGSIPLQRLHQMDGVPS